MPSLHPKLSLNLPSSPLLGLQVGDVQMKIYSDFYDGANQLRDQRPWPVHLDKTTSLPTLAGTIGIACLVFHCPTAETFSLHVKSIIESGHVPVANNRMEAELKRTLDEKRRKASMRALGILTISSTLILSPESKFLYLKYTI